TRRKLEGRELTLTKDANESGYLSIPWPVSGLGSPVCLSATLRGRPEPYHILLELARGKLNQVRRFTADWESIGLSLDLVDREGLDEATRLFGKAVVDPEDPGAAGLSEEVLARSLRLAGRIASSFSDQLLHTRHTESGQLTTGVGCLLSRL